MSEDDFGDDIFPVDDSFLREVDQLAEQATSTSARPPHQNTGNAASNGTYVSGQNRNAVPPQRTVSAGPSVFTSARHAPTAGPSRAQSLNTVFPKRSTGSGPAIQPSSDDFDDLSFNLPADSLAAFDTISSRPLPKPPNRTISGSGVIPSSGLKRSSSGNIGFMQTHLNFRRDKQSTKGKRWDRTQFAESGRRISSEKAKAMGKGKGKRRAGWDEDEEEEELDDEDLGGPLAPYPKPLVDMNAAYGPQRHVINPATIGSYIYPTNRSRRDYQYDVVRACFLDNCLVALPTGLGKTFVAGVVMLNFYRWFPTGKIVFLAPTKPLVNQQIEACQLTCGIPSRDAAVMTGQSVSAKEREKLWDERRVFYCTPQTLDNDLKRGSVDPRDIVLAVFDEAHKASGSYAYTTILAYLTVHHPYFRVLALTATPGADVPRVQAVVDALHISRIEIREAEAPEIRKYMNEKKTERHFVPMGEVIEGFRDRWGALMKPVIAGLVEKQILNERDLDYKRLRPYRLTAKRIEIARDRTSGLKWCFGSLQSLEKMARAMGNLLEFSLGMFHTTLSEIAGNSNSSGKKATSKATSGSIRSKSEFQRLLRDVEAELNCIRIGKDGRTRADRHPKMAKTLELLLAHFMQAADDERMHGVKNDTRAMVFCSYRDCVLEVVDMLNDHSPVLKATKFVGQSQGKQEQDKGFNQKEQKKTINDFKDGKYNILVSTSIGEEGLDIGEVDFVVIYDMPKQSIKLLQRIGRTGRKRDGQVHVLMSEGREDANWDTAQQNHREIQEEILHSRNLELFEDVEPLLPDGRIPPCVEQEMPVDPWDPEDQKSKRKLHATERSNTENKPSKKQRGHEVPDGANEGFKSVSELLRDSARTAKGKSRATGKKREKSPVVSEDEAEESVEEDLELLYGKVERGGSKKPRKVINRAAPKSRAANGTSKKQPTETYEEKRKKEERAELDRSALDFFNTQGPVRRRSPSPLPTPPSSPPPPASPITNKFTRQAVPPSLKDEESRETRVGEQSSPFADLGQLTPRTAAAAGFSQIAPMDLSWNMENDSFLSAVSPIVPSTRSNAAAPKSRPIGLRKPATPALVHSNSTDAMPPPPIPLSKHTPSTPIAEASPIPLGRRGPNQSSVMNLSSPAGNSPFLPLNRPRRRHVQDSSSPAVPIPRQRPREAGARLGRKRAPAAQVREYLDLDVDISGSESSDEPSSDHETESDRLFAGADFQPTQAPRGYNQRAVYLAGMATQAQPSNAPGLAFSRPRVDREAFMAKARKPVLITDDEMSEEGAERSENEYELGSFVVDDGDLSFASQSEATSYS
ncbi:hypothetical protein BCR39DRAFT_536112 [Naematelia encephala]|uniref:ATP-dependent DNA helicase n=1 Tax=Naematelia encephala TaxID=71784 RepID=A0A1Y2AZW0_9TREE|nr:hypothetical protein BCR39DRAFT_536112 [Naematelia encephala]